MGKIWHVYELCRTVKPGAATGTSKEWRYTGDPDEVIRSLRQGWKWVSGGCTSEPLCPSCQKILREVNV